MTMFKSVLVENLVEPFNTVRKRRRRRKSSVAGITSDSTNKSGSMPTTNQVSPSVILTNDRTDSDTSSSDMANHSPDEESQQTSRSSSGKSTKDYIFGKMIGEGSFSTVYLVKDIHNDMEYAIKACEKQHIIQENKAEYVKREKDVLKIIGVKQQQREDVPFFVNLYCTFQDAQRLYFVITYASGGDLLSYIKKVGVFDEKVTRFYAGELLHALEFLHMNGIIHRDLKPENILLSESMHILITDFGSAKVLQLPEEVIDDDKDTRRRRKTSFVGTAQYVSPEVLNNKPVSPSSDLWALGCIVYQMVAGLPPFRSRSEYQIFQKILKLEYDFPEGFLTKAQDLVKKLLLINPPDRLGARDIGGYPSVKKHQFFEGVEFSELYKESPPQILPYYPGAEGGEDLRSKYKVPNHLEPGLDDKQMTRLFGLVDLGDKPNDLSRSDTASSELESSGTGTSVQSVSGRSRRKRNVAIFTEEEKEERLRIQEVENEWHQFVEGNLILKQGLVDKKKGLFARRRMLLLTTGPHLYYVDPVNMVLKGEIPFTVELRPEPKNFKIFFVHTPNRTYYLDDPEGYALEWCRCIEDVRKKAFSVES